ncbi:transglutaminase domain-containing protein [Microbacterium sp. NPDC078428]|uniref:transglutaminase domain-containing protein n=1 Tax=Microbacterium sp. NPDC078428 TaxID=3364190 RepID=UPI0037C534D9
MNRTVARPRIVAGSLYVAVLTVLAAVAAWPVYRSPAFLLLVGVASATGAAIAIGAWAARWPGWLTTLATGTAVLVLGVPLAVPSRLGSPADWGLGLRDVVTGTVTAWKDLLTVELPAGQYRNLLVPALIVFLVGVCAALLFAWRHAPASAFAVVIGLAMVSFGLLFGRTVSSAPWEWGPITLAAPRETVVGAAGLIASLLWLAWQHYDERARALRRAAAGSGVRLTRSRSASDTRRMGLGAVMIVGSVIVAAAVTPALAAGAERTVLRSGVGPDLALSRAISPLAEYRAFFADSAYDEELFTVAALRGEPERVRIATLSHYDGVQYTSAGTEASAAFVRVPDRVDAGAGEAVAAQVRIDGLEGIWLPTIGRTSAVAFDGPRATALGDGFYYSPGASSAVQVAGGSLEPGDAYRIDSVVPATPPLAHVVSPGLAPSVAAPESLIRWMQQHVEGEGGAALVALVDLLRERGYLSHSVAIDAAVPPAWLSELGGASFLPSAAGHSLSRIDALFRALLQREGAASRPGESLVAAVGDDEQFAVAVALMAGELGFPARIVVGTHLSDPGDGTPFCEGGVCRGSDLRAWVEVQASDATWIPVDVTPQHRVEPTADLSRQRDPENPTVVLPETPEEVAPPDAGLTDTVVRDPDADDAGVDLTPLWGVVRTAAIGLLVVLLVAGPFLLVALAKVLRRRGRRRAPPGAAIVAGWDEFVDSAVDAGLPAPGRRTRAETAELYATAGSPTLAERADRAVFSGERTTPDEAARFWDIVDAERHAFAAEATLWRRLRAVVSLRSFARAVAPVEPVARSRDGRRQGRRTRHPHGGSRTS